MAYIAQLATILRGYTYILQRKDINNIERALKLERGQRHKDDATSVVAWVEEMRGKGEDSVVLYYKPQGASDDKTGLLREDFLIALQTPIQAEMLKKFGGKVVCVDATHGTNAYDFKLITLLVVDEYAEGFPASVNKWLQKESMWDYDLVMVPIVKGGHWTLLICDTPACTMEYYDSLGTSQGQSDFFAFLGQWMEGRDGPPAKDWKVTYPCRSKDIPLHTNRTMTVEFLCACMPCFGLSGVDNAPSSRSNKATEKTSGNGSLGSFFKRSPR